MIALGCGERCSCRALGAAEPTELERKALWRQWYLAHANSRDAMLAAHTRLQAGDAGALEEVRRLTALQTQLESVHPAIDDAIIRARAAGQWSPDWPRSAAELSRLAYDDDATLGVFPVALVVLSVLAVFAVAAVYLVLRQVAAIANSIRATLTSPVGGSVIGLAFLAGLYVWWSSRRRARYA